MSFASTPIRQATPADLARLTELEADAFSDPWPLALLRSELANPASFLLIAEPGGHPAAGYASFRHGGDEAELLRVAVATSVRRQGIARALIAHGIAELRSLGIDTCFLEVRMDNAPALAVYRSMGWGLLGMRRAYYRDGSDALVYALPIGRG